MRWDINMKSVSFVIPVYNEEERINITLQALDKGIYYTGIKLDEVIFVDDGSTDKTVKIIQEWDKYRKINFSVKIISYEENKGKGYAIKQGMNASKTDYTLFFDADMSTPLTEIKKFIPQIENDVDIIVGTRKNGHSTVIKHQPLYREFLGHGFTFLSQFILNTWITDFTCGFKAVSRKAKDEIFQKAKINRWGYDAEMIFLGRILQYSIQEVPVIWSNDDRSKVNLFTDIPKTLLDLIYIRLSHVSFLPSYIKTLRFGFNTNEELS